MPNYTTIWNKILPTIAMPDALFSVSEDAVNNLLSAHRIHDQDMYSREETLKDPSTGKPFFTMKIVVGGSKSQTPKSSKPLKIALHNEEKDAAKSRNGFSLSYEYPERNTGPFVNMSASKNITISADDINFYLEWPNRAGGVWKEHIKGINFQLEASIDLEEIDSSTPGSVEEAPQTALTIIPIALYIQQASYLGIRNQIAKSLNKTKTKLDDTKVNDLIVSLLSFAATQIGPNLVKSIPIPIAQVSGQDVYPSFFKIMDQTITMGASLKPNKKTEDDVKGLLQLVVRYEQLLQKDVEVAGGWDKVLFTKDSLDQFYSAPEPLRFKAAQKLVLRPNREVNAKLNISRAYAQQVTKELSSTKNKSSDQFNKPRQTKFVTRSKEGMAVAISEFFFDSLVSQYGNTLKEGQTRTIKVLDSIKGYLGYRLYVGTPDISISDAKGVTGSVATDAWVGLYYSYKEYHKCSFSWSSWKRAGIGIKGKPSLSLKTKKSKGVSFLASIDLNNMKLYTGISILDKLLKGLSKYFFKPFELFLNVIAVALSFVVLPGKFSPGDMKTAISVSRLSTSQYKRSGGPGNSTNNYLFIVADVEGGKA